MRQICFFLLIFSLCSNIWPEENKESLPENPFQGARVFARKGCLQCHGIGENGRKLGPDLSRIHLKGSLLDVAGLMWNHAPVMEEKMKELRISRPTFTSQEMSDLIAFLTAYQYYLVKLGAPGDPQAGRLEFEKKKCSVCHSLEDDWEKIAPSLDIYRNYSPILIAQLMWNHGKLMQIEFERLQIEYPIFEGNEMADLLAFLQRQSASEEFNPVYVEPGSPSRGKEVFHQKGCVSCHAIHGQGGKEGPDLGMKRDELVRSVSEVTGILWNHGPGMRKKMKEQGKPYPVLEGSEMSDLIAYLYFVNYFDLPGNKVVGKELFVEKGCVKCHQVGGEGGDVGPNLSKSKVITSPVEVITAMWNHAPKMSVLMSELYIKRPRFKPGEMADLIEYLLSEKDS